MAADIDHVGRDTVIVEREHAEAVASEFVAGLIVPGEGHPGDLRRRTRQQVSLCPTRCQEIPLHPLMCCAQGILGALEHELRLYASEHDREVEGLGHVVVRAEAQGRHDVLALGLGGSHDDGELARRMFDAQSLEHLDSVDFRHHDVEQHHVEALCGDPVERLLAALRCLDRVTAANQTTREQVSIRLIVVHDKQVAELLAHDLKLAFSRRPSLISLIPRVGCFRTLESGRVARHFSLVAMVVTHECRL